MPKKRRSGTNKLPFGRILKTIMEERQLTVRAVAGMAGVSPSVVQGWLNQVNPHDLQAVDRLAQALGASFKGLLLGEAEQYGNKTTAAELFEEEEFFEGLCKVRIQRLVPRKRSTFAKALKVETGNEQKK